MLIMGVKFDILNKLKEDEYKENGLTVKELVEMLGKSVDTIRGTMNRDLKKKGLVFETGEKRNGSKIYKLKEDKQGKPNFESDEFISNLLQETYDSSLFLMKFFQENKNKLQSSASKYSDKFEGVVKTLKRIKEALNTGDNQ
jgi:transposase